MDLTDLRIKDARLILDLARLGSVRELSRKTGISPGQLSKQVRLVENRLGERLIERSPQGVRLTSRASDFLPFLNDIVQAGENLVDQIKHEAPGAITCASSSFLASHLLPSALAKEKNPHSDLRLRLLEFPPDQLLPLGIRNVFQVCLHMDKKDWPGTWVTEPLGEVSWMLVCRSGNPALKAKTVEQLTEYPFIYPIYWSGQEVFYGDDSFQLSRRKRIIGHETTTAVSALQLVLNSLQLSFLPDIIMRDHLQSGAIKQIKIKGLKVQKKVVYLSVKADSVKNHIFTQLKTQLSNELARRR